MVFSNSETLDPDDFPIQSALLFPVCGGGAGLRTLEEIEKDVIAATLEATHYQISRTSEILGISRKTLLESANATA